MMCKLLIINTGTAIAFTYDESKHHHMMNMYNCETIFIISYIHRCLLILIISSYKSCFNYQSLSKLDGLLI